MPNGNCTSEEAASIAARNILKFSGTRLPVHHADADEITDPLELNDYSVASDIAPVELTECLGLACPARLDVCAICPLATEEREEDVSYSIMFVGRSMPSFDPVFQSRHESMYDLYLAAPTSRGRRSLAESSFFARMTF